MLSFPLLCAMDATDPIVGDVMSHQNEAPNSGVDGVTTEKLNTGDDTVIINEGPNESAKTVELEAKSVIVDSLAEKDGEESTLQEEFIGLALHKELGVEERNNSNNSKQGLAREVTEKTSRPKSVTTVAKKNKDGKIGSITSKQPLAIATNRRLSNDRKISGSIKGLDSGRLIKLQTRMSCTPSTATTTTNVIGLREEVRHLKPLEQGPPAKVEGSTHSSLSPEVVGAKPQRMGGLPSYGFNFKCDERAQKRKEFYAKLEEKIHAKEVERTSMQAKTQENQEAEIKMLRKSLMFKATPMPSFYREPAPPKLELKKIPPTRARSPKLGRSSKSSSVKDSDGNSSHSSQSGRLSLDEKITRNGISKGSFPQPYKQKPLRKSLPKLPSGTTTLADVAKDSASISQHSVQPNLEPEAEQIFEPSQTQTGINTEPVAEDQEQASLESQRVKLLHENTADGH